MNHWFEAWAKTVFYKASSTKYSSYLTIKLRNNSELYAVKEKKIPFSLGVGTLCIA